MDKHSLNRSRALLLNEGPSEFIEACKEEARIGSKLLGVKRDPEVSKHNLEALRNGKLNFIITKVMI